MVLRPKTNISKEVFESMLDVTVNFITSTEGLIANISWSFDSNEHNFDFLNPGDNLDIPYNITVLDTGDILLVDFNFTITIMGTSEEALIFNLTENGDDGNTQYLSKTGYMYYNGVNSLLEYDVIGTTGWGFDVTASVDTNAFIGYSTPEIPSNADLISMLTSTNVFSSYQTTYSRSEIPEGYAVLRWDWDASNNSQSSSFPGHTFDFLAEGEYMNITYNTTFTDGLGFTDTRDIIINISGTNDGPVITTPSPIISNKVYDFSTTPRGWQYFDGGSTDLYIEDLDFSDGNMSARITNVFNLIVNRSYITSFPEWPGLNGLGNMLSISFSNQKEDLSNNAAYLPDTDAAIDVKFNEPVQLDFAFLGPGDNFSFDATVEVTDAQGDIDTVDVRINFKGWADAYIHTVQLLKDSTGSVVESTESQDAILITEDNFDNISHKITVPEGTNYPTGKPVFITLDRTYNPNKPIYAFYEIELEGPDRSGMILYDGIGTTFGVANLKDHYGWALTDLPHIWYAYNLSESDREDTTKYTSSSLAATIDGTELKVLGERICTINIMIEIPASALSQTWPTFGGEYNFGIVNNVILMTNLQGTNSELGETDEMGPFALPLRIFVIDLADLPT